MSVLQPQLDLSRAKSAQEQEEIRPFLHFLLSIGAEYVRWLPDSGPYIDRGRLIAWFPGNRRLVYTGAFARGFGRDSSK